MDSLIEEFGRNRVTFSQRLFFKRFPFRAQVCYQNMEVRNPEVEKALASVAGEWHQRGHDCFYFLTESDVSAFCTVVRRSSSRLIITCPRSESLMNAMTLNEDAIVRSTLFWDKYRYKIVYKWGFHERNANLAILKHHFGKMDQSQRVYHGTDYPLTIYAETDADLMMVKLGTDNISKIFRIILNEEVDDNAGIAEQVC